MFSVGDPEYYQKKLTQLFSKYSPPIAVSATCPPTAPVAVTPLPTWPRVDAAMPVVVALVQLCYGAGPALTTLSLCRRPQVTVAKKADSLYKTVSAASIAAKVRVWPVTLQRTEL
jgi:hypothetical protein